MEQKYYYQHRKFIVFYNDRMEIGLDSAIDPKNAVDIIRLDEIARIDIKKSKIYWVSSFVRWVWIVLSYDTTTNPIKKDEEKIIIKKINGNSRNLLLQTNKEEIKNKFIGLNLKINVEVES